MPDNFNNSQQPPTSASPVDDAGRPCSSPDVTQPEMPEAATIIFDRRTDDTRGQCSSAPAQRVPVTPVSAPPRPVQKIPVTPVSTPSVPARKVPVTPSAVAYTPEPPEPPQKPLSNDEVTARTASLWKYLPIPGNEPEPYPETINGTVNFPGSTVIAARVRGKKHKHDGTNCDDWYELAHLDDITFAAVSDGAGSKKFSRIGARESCKATVQYLVRSFAGLFSDKSGIKKDIALPLEDPRCGDACGMLAALVQQSVIKAYDAVEAAFQARKDNPAYSSVLGRPLEFRDFSGTLLVAVIIPVSKETKEHLIISCQIGDGMIAILNSKGGFDKSLRLMGIPDSGEYSGQTDFLTSEKMRKIETLQHRTMLSRTVVDTVMLMSDGVADDYFPNETQMRRLYFDMIVNGIIDRGVRDIPMSKIPPSLLNLYKRVPDPLAYPWVNDQSVSVPIQYTNRIMEATGLTLEDLWKDPTILAMARHELTKNGKNADPGKRLLTWLDNYVERGSFDDRTLVLVTL